MLTFTFPIAFVLILLIPVVIFMEIKKKNKTSNFYASDLLKKIYKKSSLWWYFELFLKSLIILIFTLILANPKINSSYVEDEKNGIDISIVLDISKSMLAEDLKPNRIEIAKKVIGEFLDKLTSDRVSFLIFAGKPFTSIPLTFDYSAIKNYITNLTTDSINQSVPGLSGTAIGDALLIASDNLTSSKDEKKREKIIILITDGEANVGVDPKVSYKYLVDKKIKIYTVGIGSKDGTPLFMTDDFGNKQYFLDQNGEPIKAKLDEDLLKFLSSKTGGTYYHVKDAQSMEKIFDEISKLHKSEIKYKLIKSQIPVYQYFLFALFFVFFLLIITKNKFIYR